MPDWRLHVESLLRTGDLDPAELAQVGEELTEHLNDRYHALLGEGAQPAAAEQQVVRELQQGELLAELRRVLRRPALSEPEPGSASVLASVWRDVRYGLRQLRLSP